MIGNSFIFHYVEDFKHTARAVIACLHRKRHCGTLSFMDWPPQSPDLNVHLTNHHKRAELKAANIQQGALNVLHEV